MTILRFFENRALGRLLRLDVNLDGMH